MYNKIIDISTNFIKSIIPEDKRSQLQSKLFQINFYIKIEELLCYIIISTLSLTLLTLTICIILQINPILCILPLIGIPILCINYLIYKSQKHKDAIEEQLPGYLNQIASLLRVGLGLESALTELSEQKGPLPQEIKRALTEIRFGKPFNKALLDIAQRNESENLKHTFEIIIHSRNSGANLANILEMIASDLSDNLTLKKERKASVMMSVMFLLIASVIAIPFCFSMIGLYSTFIENAGRTNPLINIMPTASIGYIIIHSILVSILMAIVLYSNYKKSVKFMIIILPASLSIYFIAGTLFKNILLGGLI